MCTHTKFSFSFTSQRHSWLLKLVLTWLVSLRPMRGALWYSMKSPGFDNRHSFESWLCHLALWHVSYANFFEHWFSEIPIFATPNIERGHIPSHGIWLMVHATCFNKYNANRSFKSHLWWNNWSFSLSQDWYVPDRGCFLRFGPEKQRTWNTDIINPQGRPVMWAGSKPDCCKPLIICSKLA